MSDRPDCSEDVNSRIAGRVNPVAADGQAPEVTVVIPVYNEGDEILDNCLAAVRKVLDEYGKTWEIIFIDDFSTDNSLPKLLTFLEQDSRITVVEHFRNLGAVQAILSGLRHSRGQIVIPFDPDLQFAPESIPQLVSKVLEGYDFVGGIRMNRNDTILKKLSSSLGSFLIGNAMGVAHKDFGSIKAYSRRVVDGILGLPQDYMAIQAAACTVSKHFVEIPIRHQPRTIGASKWTFLMRLEYFMDVFTSYARYPFSGILALGFLVSLVSMIFDFGAAIWWFARGGSLDLVFLGVMALGAFGCILGIQLMGLALLGKFIMRTFRRKFQLPHRTVSRVHLHGTVIISKT